MIFRAVEDVDLIIQTGKGDVEAYNLLISRWEKRVFNYLLRIVGNREDAFDLSQDVFLKAYQNIRKLEDTSRFGPWLFRIAHNEAYSMFRKKRPEVPESELPERATAHAFPMEMSLAVTAALERLSIEQKETVLLKIYQGFKFEEIAEILDPSVDGEEPVIYRARSVEGGVGDAGEE